MLSIIIPVYNADKTICKCLESILNDNPSFPYEVIAVNDGSLDQSQDILERISKENSHLIVFNKSNGGVSSARNFGISRARGRWIMFVDADDYLSPGWADLVSKQLDNSSNFVVFSQQEYNDFGFENTIEMITGLRNGPFMSCIWSKLYKREIIQQHNIKFLSGVINGEDSLFNLNYYLCCRDINYVQENIYNYYINTLSATNRLDLRFLDSDIEYQKRLMDILNTESFKFDYICKFSILNAWLVFFNRYSIKNSYNLNDFKALYENNMYFEVLKDYRKYSQYFSKVKRFLLSLLSNGNYWIVYKIFKLKNKLKKQRYSTRVERI